MAAHDDKRDEFAAEQPVGKVVTDSDGNRVWKWVNDALDSTTRLLMRLNNDDLTLESTDTRPLSDKEVRQRRRLAELRGDEAATDEELGVGEPTEGSDPYNSGPTTNSR